MEDAKKKKAGWLREKFHKLKQEGYKGDQRVAIALSMWREKKKKEKGGSKDG